MSNETFNEIMEKSFREELKNAAKGIHELYVSFREAGFTDDQAMKIVVSMLFSGRNNQVR